MSRHNPPRLEVGRTYQLEGEGFVARVTPVETWRIDAKRLKSEQAPLYAAYAKKSTSLRLEVVPS